MSDQLHVPPTLSLLKECPVPVGLEGGWAPRSVWSSQKEKFLLLPK